MKSIYDQFDAAFANVSAYAISIDGEHVARVAIKYPQDGAGRLYAYVHILGGQMVRGSATGYGYDKRSAAVVDAAGKLTGDESYCAALFKRTLAKDGGYEWTTYLEKAGFTVDQVI